MGASPHPAFLPLADGLDRHNRSRLFSLARVRTPAAREVLLREGVPPPFVALVGAGVLVAEVTSHWGRRAVVGILRRGEVFGESALSARAIAIEDGWRPLTPNPHAARPCWPEVRALVRSRVLCFDPRGFRDLLERDGGLRAWLTDRLLERLQRGEARLAQALSLPVTERVEAILRDLADARGSASTMPVTQEDLAGMAGATRESVNRALARLIREERVERKGPSYRVLSPDEADGSFGPLMAVSSNRSSGEPPTRVTRPSRSSLSR
jgi:CRP/FNR family cyclic AMP-dependent transcriptional regulator